MNKKGRDLLGGPSPFFVIKPFINIVGEKHFKPKATEQVILIC